MADTLPTRGVALICTEDERIKAAVAAAGYSIADAPTAALALPELRHRPIALVAFDPMPERETLAFVDALAGRRRRELFVLRCGDGVRTGDRFEAWQSSADLVVHADDLGDLPQLLEGARQEKDAFYDRFREAQAAAGARLGAHA